MTRKRLLPAALLACLLFATPVLAGPLTGGLAYIQNNVVTDIETLAIIALAIIMFSMQIRWMFIIGVCAGIWILANTDTIRGAFAGG